MTTVEQSRTTRTEAPTIMPFGGWETTPIPAGFADPAVLFRFPTADDPAPATTRVLGMSLYTAALGLTGVVAALRGLVTVVGGAPVWFMPAVGVLTALSVAAAAAAHLSIHRPALPWLLLGAAAGPMAGATALAMLY